jgi:hypothetical protein
MSLRHSISGFQKKAKDKLSKIWEKAGKGRPNVVGEEFDHSTLSLQSEPAIVVEGGSGGRDSEVGAGAGDSEVGAGGGDPPPDDSQSISQSAVGIGHSDQGGGDDTASGGEISQARSIFISIRTCRLRVGPVEKGGTSRSCKVRNFALRQKRYSTRRPNFVTADETQQDRKSTASADTKLILRGVKESQNAYPLLKSVAEGLCFILDNWEVRPPPVRSICNAYGRSSERQ